MPFHTFHQNNSGGSFRKPAIDVIVEGDSIEEIVERALGAGIYFDGCKDGTDCSCCGDRWYAPWTDKELDDVPSVYGEPVHDREVSDMYKAWAEADGIPNTMIVYADGSKETL
jgi:hypothetical protein